MILESVSLLTKSCADVADLHEKKPARLSGLAFCLVNFGAINSISVMGRNRLQTFLNHGDTETLRKNIKTPCLCAKPPWLGVQDFCKMSNAFRNQRN